MTIMKYISISRINNIICNNVIQYDYYMITTKYIPVTWVSI